MIGCRAGGRKRGGGECLRGRSVSLALESFEVGEGFFPCGGDAFEGIGDAHEFAVQFHGTGGVVVGFGEFEFTGEDALLFFEFGDVGFAAFDFLFLFAAGDDACFAFAVGGFFLVAGQIDLAAGIGGGGGFVFRAAVG